MNVKIIPVTKDNLDLVVKAGAKFGLLRSVGWLRRCLYDPTVEDLTDDKIRGHVAVDEDTGGVIAVQCYCYWPCYLKQQKILGCTGAIMGSVHKYGEVLVSVLEANNATRHGSVFGFANDYANNRAAKVSKVFNRHKEPPYRSREFRVAIADVSAYAMLICERLKLPFVFKNVIWYLFRPLSWLINGTKRLVERGLEFDLVVRKEFEYDAFGDFWNRFLEGNDGLVSSREPERLRFMFGEPVKAGVVKLITAEREGRILGYVMLRKKTFMKDHWPYRTEIVDICAVNNDVACLRALASAAVQHSVKMKASMVCFFGYMPNQEEWLDPYFKFKRMDDHPSSLAGSRSNKEIRDTLQQNRGWFWGPFDGERCLGYGGYVDL